MNGRVAIAGIVLPLSLGLAVVGWAALSASDRYFPQSVIVEQDCADHNIPAVGGMKLAGYVAEDVGSVLRGLQERPLYPRRDDASRVLRFTWIRTFASPVAVRIETQANGTAQLFAQRAPGFDSCAAGSDCTTSRVLTSTEQAHIESLAQHAMARPTFTCLMGLDGSRWFFETSGGGDYRFMHRWSPPAGPEHTLGVAMLELTGWRFEDSLESVPDDFWGEFAPPPSDQTS